MSIPLDLLGVYSGLRRGDLFYLSVRWRLSPIGCVERLLPDSGTIYDIGCGAGLLSNLASLRSPSRRVTGIDVSEEKIRIANSSVGNRSNIRFIKSDALLFDFSGADGVVLCDAMHHIPFDGQEKLLKKIHTSLKDGGRLVVQEIAGRPAHKYIFARAVDFITGAGEPVFYRGAEEWASLLTGMGYEVNTLKLDKAYPVSAVAFVCVKPGSSSGGGRL